MYIWTGSQWSQDSTLVASDASAGDLFGNGISIFGSTAMITALKRSDTGMYYLFFNQNKTLNSC